MPIAKQRLTRINSSTKEKITVQGMEIVTSTLYISVTEKSAINAKRSSRYNLHRSAMNLEIVNK